MCICVSAHMCNVVHVCVHVHLESEVYIGSFQLSLPTLNFETGSLAEPRAHQLARVMAKQALGFPLSLPTPSSV